MSGLAILPTSPGGERAVVSDDGERIVLSIYAMHSAKQLAEVEMPPILAMRLAAELIRAASLHLCRRGIT